MMQRTIGAACRATNRLAWFGSRSYCFEADNERRGSDATREQSFEKSVNKVTLLGRIGTDPQFNEFNNTVFSNFRLATTLSYVKKDTNERNQITTWHSISASRPYITRKLEGVGKGSRVYIEGRLDNREWTDRDGKRSTITNILADELIILHRREKAEESFSNKSRISEEDSM
ncbi:single-stranded DNA-binding protein, mitochondrial-like [Pecten maximus]|uniref:single-stranded DNA-binding protein, mitochondrial-like n=1 Tax=Pecten maximus TaxID=6579 RepID=UPI00145840F5|nr:single-stranded DNA-binding protein, mitochondrial-like [Pecten maximus]